MFYRYYTVLQIKNQMQTLILQKKMASKKWQQTLELMYHTNQVLIQNLHQLFIYRLELNICEQVYMYILL